jgi:capsid protein
MFERLRSQLASAREQVAAAVSVARGIVPNLPISALSPFTGGFGSFNNSFQTGDKFPGGFGETQLLAADYWTLRARSRQLFETNLYARGLIRRLVTNEIAVGLHLEATPVEKLLGKAEDSLADWSEDVEQRFALWQADPWLCDHAEQRTFGALQIAARMDALIEGDVLVVLRQFQPTQLPRLQLISGGMVQTPMMGRVTVAQGHRIVHGVELDAMNRHVAFWVTQSDGTSKRIPAWGEKSGRRLAWLVYGTERRLDDVRGKPILALVLQSLREIDRYRDSVQRKAVINSMLAMFVKRTADSKTATRPMTSGAVRKGSLPTGNESSSPEQPRRFNVAELIPGLVIDELAPGEEPHGFAPNGTDEKFGDFEEAVIQAVAWAHEIPPEILRLSFSSNYSASQAAINEFKLYLNKVRVGFGDEFCQPVYIEWLIAMTLAGKIAAAQLIEAWRDSRQYDVFAAWTSCDWSGNIKLSVDLTKLATGYDLLIKMGGITRDRMSRELTGTKFSQNVKKLRLENEALVRANEPLTKLDPKFLPADAAPNDDAGGDDSSDNKDAAATPLRVVS